MEEKGDKFAYPLRMSCPDRDLLDHPGTSSTIHDGTTKVGVVLTQLGSGSQGGAQRAHVFAVLRVAC